MSVIKSHDAIGVIGKTLSLLDDRLVDHGQRVAYILLQMLKYKGTYHQKQISDICQLALLHDVGAYKTDEIDRMVEFESKNVWEHSIYGYLFLKHLSPLAHLAEIILYHHLAYQQLKEFNVQDEMLCQLFNLADRVDVIYLSSYDDDQILKALTMHKDKIFNEEVIEWFREANQTYGILDHLRNNLYIDELELLFSETVLSEREIDQYLRLLAFAIDFRSEHTVVHTIMTVANSLEIGKKMGLSKDQLDKIYYGALLHDLGKITTPTAILEKPGKLTTKEMDIMRNHVVMTTVILQDCIEEDICQIASRHHEKMDGTGYPERLTADQLTISQRIVAIADILSALNGQRSYKLPFSKHKVIDILQGMVEKQHICPKIAEVTIKNYDEIVTNVAIESRQVLTAYQQIIEAYPRILKQCQESIEIMNS